jgi:hypothetical protein
VLQVAIVQLPPKTDTRGSDTFSDIIDVGGVVIPLTIVVVVLAVIWPGMKRWFRHRARRRRRRRHHDAHPDTPRVP